MLALERIKELTKLNETFVPPSDFNAQRLLDDPFSVVKGECFPIRLRFDAEQSPYIIVDDAVMHLLGMAEMIGLVESKEYELMGLIGPPAEILSVDTESVQGRIKYTNMPIRDFWIPDDAFISTWHDKLQGFRSVLLAGNMLGIHCMGGRGRSGTVAAMLLIDLGMKAEKAIIAVRAARPGAIEAGEQEQFVRAYRHLNDDRI